MIQQLVTDIVAFLSVYNIIFIVLILALTSYLKLQFQELRAKFVADFVFVIVFCCFYFFDVIELETAALLYLIATKLYDYADLLISYLYNFSLYNK